MASQIETVMGFVKATKFDKYQKLTLPNGFMIPGIDRSDVAEAIFPKRLDGKTLLDVGCYYGYFLHNAVERGADRTVGVELDASRCEIARKLAPLWGGKIEIIHGLIEDVAFDEKFDYVLLLNILHHVKDPLAVMKKLAGLCRDTLIVEFRQPYDVQFLGQWQDLYKLHAGGRIVRRIRRLGVQIRATILRWFTRNIPIMGIGAVPFDRVTYYNEKAFKNMFLVQHKLFKNIECRHSLQGKGGQLLAFCDCSD